MWHDDYEKTSNAYVLWKFILKTYLNLEMKNKEKLLFLTCAFVCCITSVAAQDKFMTIVAQDGSGDYKTVTEAVAAAKADGNRTIIFVKSGTYKEHVAIPSNKVISILGEDRDNTVITYDKNYAAYPNNPDSTCTLCVSGQYFYGENFTSENTVGPNGGQAGCLFNYKGDCMVVKNMSFKANQDGVRFNTNTRNYMKDCYIEGSVDYIYDSGIAFIDDCTIKQVNRAGYILAPGNCSATFPRATVRAYTGKSRLLGVGIFVRHSTLTYDPATISEGSTYLGRPWGDSSNAGYFLYCRMDKHIASAGWSDMSGNAAGGTPCYLGEYGSMDMDGAPIDLSNRVSWCYTDSEYSYTKNNIMSKNVADNLFDMKRVDSLVVAQLKSAGRNLSSFDPIPMVTPAATPSSISLTGNVLSWSSVGDAAGYIIYRNGKYFAHTTLTSADVENAEGDTYTLRTVTATGCLSEPVSPSTTGITQTMRALLDVKVSGNNVSWNTAADATVVNSIGAMMMREKNVKSINLTGLATGIYVVRISDGKNVATEKVFVK